MNRSTIALLALLVAGPILAQTVPPQTQVDIVAREMPRVQGRLIASDSATLTVARRDSELVVPRDRIVRLTANRRTTRQFVVPLSIGAGLVGAAFGALLGAGLCESSDCGGAATEGAVMLGGFGVGVGALTGVVVGGIVRWHQSVASSVRVAGRPEGANAIEVCGPQPTLQGDYGVSFRRSKSSRLSATFFCTPRLSLGAEVAWPYDKTDFPLFSTSSASTTWGSITDRRRLQLGGAFAELPVRGPLNPRLILSGGYYRALTAVQIDSFITTNGTMTLHQAHRETRDGGVGGSVGFGVSMPLWQKVSLGAEVREHLYDAGGVGSKATFGLTLRIRP